MREFRRLAGRVNQQRSLRDGVIALRHVIPGDSSFGDPLSTAGAQPLQAAARQARTRTPGRLSVAAELGLGMLQLAEWLRSDVRRRRSDTPLVILFTDLAGFSSWALDAGDERSLELLRKVDAVVASMVEEYGGQVVKRLGDGTMAVFDHPVAGIEAAARSLREARCVEVDGYRPRLRAGVHAGSPQAIGGDYVGIDVNVAARLCEVANAGEILVSEPGRDGVAGRFELTRRDIRGAPSSLRVYRLGGRLDDRKARSAVDEHIKEGQRGHGSEDRAEEIAARVVDKQRARSRETRTRSRTWTQNTSSGRRGGRRAGRPGACGRTRDQLYSEARQLGIEGRSKMNKDQLGWAVDRKSGRR